MPFASSPALRFNQLAAEFYSSLKVADDGLSLKAKVQGARLLLSKDALSSGMGVVDIISEETDTLEFKKEAFNHLFGPLGIPFDNFPPQFTFMLFQSFSHRILH